MGVCSAFASDKLQAATAMAHFMDLPVLPKGTSHADIAPPGFVLTMSGETGKPLTRQEQASLGPMRVVSVLVRSWP